jgi:hypothetical protein
VALPSKNRPPTIRIKSRPEISWERTVKSGSVRRMTQVIEKSSRMRMSMASPKPTRRASAGRFSGSLSVRIEIKMMLSMPSTISSAVRVKSAIQICGFANQSKPAPFSC